MPCALLAACAVELFCGAGQARPVALDLSYSAPPECPSATELREAVEKLVTEQPNQPFAARVAIGLEGSRYVARITPSDGSERVLSGVSCGEVVEATEVVLALAISPQQAESAANSRPQLSAATPERSSLAAPLPSRLARESPSSVRASAGAALAGELGALPGPTLGIVARLGIASTHWSLAAEGSYFLPRSATLSGDARRGGRFSLSSAAALGCGAPVAGSVRVGLCGGAELGRIAGDGFAPTPTHEVSGTWLALLAGPELRISIAGPLRLRASAGVAVPFVGRHPFTLNGNTVHRPGPLSLRSALGLELVF